jgi:hypothetical protein
MQILIIAIMMTMNTSYTFFPSYPSTLFAHSDSMYAVVRITKCVVRVTPVRRSTKSLNASEESLAFVLQKDCHDSFRFKPFVP